MADRPFNRRDFLKVAAVGAGALVAPKIIKGLHSLEEESTGHIESVETDFATYYPIFEKHDESPNLVKVLSPLKQKPDIHFFELVTNPAKDFQKIGNMEIQSIEAYGNSGKSFGKLIPDETIAFFSQNNISVAFEGVMLDEKYVKSSFATADTEFSLSLGTVAAGWALKAYQDLKGAKVKPITSFLETLGTALPAIWLGGSAVSGGFGTILDDLPETGDSRKIKESFYRVSSFIEEFHPENMVVFFRNLIMARKLQTLGKSLTGSVKDRKPAISFLAGYLHGGISDLLRLGETATLSGFSLYSKEILKDIVDKNGGIEPFCSTMVVPVSPRFDQGLNAKSFVLDTELKDYLETRLE